jgi:predicted PurR-regulated permease PerM
MIGSFGVYLFYRKIIGPELILKVGGRVLDPKTQAKYAIGFSQMFVDKAPRYTFTAGFELLVDWITYYFGSFLLPAIISMGGVFVAFWPVKKEEKFFSRIFLSKNPVFCTLLFSLSALLFMNCLMVKNHPGIYKALTAKLSYYGLPTMGLVLFASSWVVDRLNKKFTANKPLINLFLFLILILNIFSMDRHSEDFINTYNTYPGPSVETRYRNLVNCISSRGVNIPSSMDGNNQRLCKALLSIDGGECL